MVNLIIDWWQKKLKKEEKVGNQFKIFNPISTKQLNIENLWILTSLENSPVVQLHG